jgi:hypothetical protein
MQLSLEEGAWREEVLGHYNGAIRIHEQLLEQPDVPDRIRVEAMHRLGSWFGFTTRRPRLRRPGPCWAGPSSASEIRRPRKLWLSWCALRNGQNWLMPESLRYRRYRRSHRRRPGRLSPL